MGMENTDMRTEIILRVTISKMEREAKENTISQKVGSFNLNLILLLHKFPKFI